MGPPLAAALAALLALALLAGCGSDADPDAGFPDRPSGTAAPATGEHPEGSQAPTGPAQSGASDTAGQGGSGGLPPDPATGAGTNSGAVSEGGGAEASAGQESDPSDPSRTRPSGSSGDSGDPGDSGDADDPSASDWQLFDMDAIADAASADCSFSSARTRTRDAVQLDVWDVAFTSWESVDGVLQPIRIRGYAARPRQASAPLPGVVLAHGLGGHADESHATGLASLLGMFVIAYSGPGSGTVPANTSEGRSSGYGDGYRLFDTLVDPRGSWFWGHSVAGMRGLTCLAAHPEVDAERLGMTGYSAGGVATLLAASADDRIVAAVPLSGTGGWAEAVASPNAWQHVLLAQPGLSVESDEWQILLDHLDSANRLHDTQAQVLMINGSTDQFFPLNAHMATAAAIP